MFYTYVRTSLQMTGKKYCWQTTKDFKKVASNDWRPMPSASRVNHCLLVYLETNINYILCFARRIIARFIDMCIFENVCFYGFTRYLFLSLLLLVACLIDRRSSSERKSFSNEAPMSFFLFWYSIINHDQTLEKEKSSLKHFSVIGTVGH